MHIVLILRSYYFDCDFPFFYCHRKSQTQVSTKFRLDTFSFAAYHAEKRMGGDK